MCILLVCFFFLLQTYTRIHRHSMAMSRRKQLHPKSLKGTGELEKKTNWDEIFIRWTWHFFWRRWWNGIYSTRWTQIWWRSKSTKLRKKIFRLEVLLLLSPLKMLVTRYRCSNWFARRTSFWSICCASCFLSISTIIHRFGFNKYE